LFALLVGADSVFTSPTRTFTPGLSAVWSPAPPPGIATGTTGQVSLAGLAPSRPSTSFAAPQDFIELLDVTIHPGLIVLRESGLSRQEQWEWLRPVVQQVKKSGDEDFLLNKLIEISGVGRFEVRDMPEP
jgi:hypothetical protein